MFPGKLPGLSSEREREFSIELIPEAAPISMALNEHTIKTLFGLQGPEIVGSDTTLNWEHLKIIRATQYELGFCFSVHSLL